MEAVAKTRALAAQGWTDLLERLRACCNVSWKVWLRRAFVWIAALSFVGFLPFICLLDTLKITYKPGSLSLLWMPAGILTLGYMLYMFVEHANELRRRYLLLILPLAFFYVSSLVGFIVNLQFGAVKTLMVSVSAGICFMQAFLIVFRRLYKPFIVALGWIYGFCLLCFLIEIARDPDGRHFVTYASQEGFYLTIGYLCVHMAVYTIFRAVTLRWTGLGAGRSTLYVALISAGFVGSLGVMTASGARGAILVTALLALGYAFSRKYKARNTLVLAFALCATVFVLNAAEILLFLKGLIPLNGWKRLFSMVDAKGTFSLYSIFHGREKNVVQGFEAFLRAPLFGNGMYYYQYYPHNMFVEWLADQGALLSLPMFGMLALSLRTAWRKAQEGKNAAPMFLWMFLGTLGSLMFSYTYKTSSYYWFFIGLFLTQWLSDANFDFLSRFNRFRRAPAPKRRPRAKRTTRSRRRA